MSSDAFESRARALEDQFFHQKDQQLLDKFRANLEAKEATDALASSSGINDSELLSTLVAMNIRAETLASLSLLPLVAVAWADGKMEEGERAAILKAADERGLNSESAGFSMVQAWLENKPEPELFVVWREYVGALGESMDPASFAKLRDEVLAQAKSVAEAAGGFLGLVSKISPVEQTKLDELSEAFETA